MLNSTVEFKAWPAINTLSGDECLGMYFLPRPSSDNCLSVRCLSDLLPAARHSTVVQCDNAVRDTYLRCTH